MPMTPFIGVRISCDMEARNSPLAGQGAAAPVLPARDGFGANINPPPLAGMGPHPILGLDEGDAAVALAGDTLVVKGQVLGMNERLPGLNGRRHALVLVTQHGPQAGTVIDVPGGDIPLKDADPG